MKYQASIRRLFYNFQIYYILSEELRAPPRVTRKRTEPGLPNGSEFGNTERVFRPNGLGDSARFHPREGDPGLIAGQVYVVLTFAMTKQDIQEYYGQSIYQIQMNVATQAFVQMVCNQPIETAFPEMAVLALNAANEFTATVLASPKPS
jgi:hypothetical protein